MEECALTVLTPFHVTVSQAGLVIDDKTVSNDITHINTKRIAPCLVLWLFH